MASGRTYIIADMACSHEGSPELARKIIDGAAKAGADAIQFQIWSLAECDVPKHPDYVIRQRVEMPQSIWLELADYVRSKYPQMQIIGCVYERTSVDLCERMNVDAYKLHSADLSNPYLVKYVAGKRRRIDLSVGASSIEEIQTAIDWIRRATNTGIWLMYGIQLFPTRTEDIHLSYMMKLKQLFELPMGYQDHSDADAEAAFWLPAAAVGMGVDIVEKHITHDRSLKGVDYQAALNPPEFCRFVKMVREIEKARGRAVPQGFSPAEVEYRKYAKKSIVASHDLTAGTVISEHHISFMRAAGIGLPPDQSWRVLGKKTCRALSRYDLILETDVT